MNKNKIKWWAITALCVFIIVPATSVGLLDLTGWSNIAFSALCGILVAMGPVRKAME